MEIWIPDSAKPAFVCRVPKVEGGVCGAQFTADEHMKFERHVISCAAHNEDGAHAQSPRTLMPALYDSELWDPEWEAHMREVGRRMEAEGRLEVRPNER